MAAIPEMTVSEPVSVMGAASVTQLEMMPKAPDTARRGQSVAGVAEGLQDRLRSGGSDRGVRTGSAYLHDDSQRILKG